MLLDSFSFEMRRRRKMGLLEQYILSYSIIAFLFNLFFITIVAIAICYAIRMKRSSDGSSTIKDPNENRKKKIESFEIE